MYKEYKVDGKLMFNKIFEHPIITEKLEPGYYIVHSFGIAEEIFIEPTKFAGDNIVKFTKGIVQDITQIVVKHFSKENTELYKNLGIACKLGVLLYGKAGTGKTTTAKIIMQEFIDNHKAIVLDWSKCEVTKISSTIANIRKSGFNGLIVIFIDEIEIDISDYEATMLNLLDGIDSPENTLFIGCTNYLDKIPDRFKKRPSRFKIVQEINAFPFEVYKQFIDGKVKDIKTSIDWSKVAYFASEKGLTLDELKHIIVHMIADKMTMIKAYNTVTKFSDSEVLAEEADD